VVKDFLDTGAQSAILAVNLSVADDEEKDKLASSLISTALTLARENIPSVLTVYNHREVVNTTKPLDPRQALIRALSLSQEVTISLNPLRYLQLPDVIRLKGNIHRLRHISSDSSVRLAEVLDLEYKALSVAAMANPATAALFNALQLMKERVNVLIVSGCNHDAEAIALGQATLKERGYQVLTVDLGRKL
jgi:hypothetical protein